MSETVHVARARFWRRAFAVCIDFVIVSAAVAVIGIALAKLTDGKVRVANALINTTECAQLAQLPAGVRVPEGFTVTHIARCTRYFIWIRYDWFLNVAEATRTGPATTYTRTFTVPLDPDGRVASPFYLDALGSILFIAYVFMQERRDGASAGKRALGLRVQSLSEQPPNPMQIAKRLVRFAPGAILVLGSLSGNIALFWYLWGVSLMLWIAILVNFIMATRRDDLPWHDRWAGTEVVHQPAQGQPTAASPA